MACRPGYLTGGRVAFVPTRADSTRQSLYASLHAQNIITHGDEWEWRKFHFNYDLASALAIIGRETDGLELRRVANVTATTPAAVERLADLQERYWQIGQSHSEFDWVEVLDEKAALLRELLAIGRG